MTVSLALLARMFSLELPSLGWLADDIGPGDVAVLACSYYLLREVMPMKAESSVCLSW